MPRLAGQTDSRQPGPREEFEEELTRHCPAGYFQTLQDNVKQWSREANVCRFWNAVQARVRIWSEEYRRRTGEPLLSNTVLPEFVGKSVESIKSKLFRVILRQDEAVATLMPAELYYVPRINDLVRTRMDCTFLDGVGFLAQKLRETAKELGVEMYYYPKGELDGYYAHHFYFLESLKCRLGGGELLVPITCEVQIGTELATKLWKSSHSVYEETRETDERPADWQWNAENPKFISRQLGHMIHLADGLLIQLRTAAQKSRGTRK